MPKTPVDGATKVVARLTLVIEYDYLPKTEELEELVESARGGGHVTKADVDVLRATTISLR